MNEIHGMLNVMSQREGQVIKNVLDCHLQQTPQEDGPQEGEEVTLSK